MDWRDAVDRRLDRAVQNVAEKNMRYEKRIKELEEKLGLGVKNGQTLSSEIEQTKARVEETERLLKIGFNNHITQIRRDLESSARLLRELEIELPQKIQNIEGISELYKSGRRRAQIFEKELQWLTMGWMEQLRRTAMHQESPRSHEWQQNVRLIIYFLVALSSFILSIVFGYPHISWFWRMVTQHR